MEKAIFTFISALIFSMSGGSGGRVDTVSVLEVESEIYSQHDIEEAEEAVLDYFENEFSGCSLTELAYIGDDKNNEYIDFATRHDASEVMVFLSDFDVDSSGGDGSLEPNSTYTDWNWILIKNQDGKWEHITHGY